MENEEHVEPQEVVEEIAQDHPPEEVAEQVEQRETQVPLSALQKERRKRQEMEQELHFLKSQSYAPPPPQVEDTSRYESATREDLSRSQAEAVRIVEEKLWIRQNPEKYEKVNEYLPEFLKQRPNLCAAIGTASNRYEEAYILMEALTPKQQQQLKKDVVKKEAPNAPTSIPKAASLNHSVDVMNMSDSDFNAWRKQQKRR